MCFRQTQTVELRSGLTKRTPYVVEKTEPSSFSHMTITMQLFFHHFLYPKTRHI